MTELEQLRDLAGDGAAIGCIVSLVVSVVKRVAKINGNDDAAFLIVTLCFGGTLLWAALSQSFGLATWLVDAGVAIAASKLMWLLISKRVRNWLTNGRSSENI